MNGIGGPRSSGNPCEPAESMRVAETTYMTAKTVLLGSLTMSHNVATSRINIDENQLLANHQATGNGNRSQQIRLQVTGQGNRNCKSVRLAADTRTAWRLVLPKPTPTAIIRFRPDTRIAFKSLRWRDQRKDTPTRSSRSFDCAQDFACGLPLRLCLRSRPQNSSSCQRS